MPRPKRATSERPARRREPWHVTARRLNEERYYRLLREVTAARGREPARDWLDHAPCKGSAGLFFPADVGLAAAQSYQRAAVLCDRCTVRVDCFLDGESLGDGDGMRAGLSPTMREMAALELRRRGIRFPTSRILLRDGKRVVW